MRLQSYITATFLAVLVLAVPFRAYAQVPYPYGTGPYGQCEYGGSCPSTDETDSDGGPITPAPSGEAETEEPAEPEVPATTSPRTPRSGTPSKQSEPRDRLLTSNAFGGVIYEKIGELAKNIPTPIARAFPYFLLLLLLLLALRLLLQAQKEAKRVQIVETTIEEEKRLGLEKDNFVMLSAHYLRTPLTVVKGNVELMQSLGHLTTEASQKLSAAVAVLSDQIAALLQKSEGNKQLSVIQPKWNSVPFRVALNPLFLAPIIAVGIIMVVAHFIFLDFRVTAPNIIDFLVQLALIAMISQVIFSNYRQVQLKKANRADQERILQKQQELDVARSEFIMSAAKELEQKVQELKAAIVPLQAQPEVAKLSAAVSQLGAMVAKFKLVAYLKTQNAQLDKSSFSLHDLLTEAVEPYNKTAEAKAIKFTSHTEDEHIIQQKQLVSFLLQSLVDNAIKFSPNNTTIDVSAKAEGERVEFSVTDQGKGISPEKQELLFKPFSRTESVETFDSEGLGFSLYLDKVIAHYLHGDIRLDSKQGQGTSVIIDLPATI